MEWVYGSGGSDLVDVALFKNRRYHSIIRTGVLASDGFLVFTVGSKTKVDDGSYAAHVLLSSNWDINGKSAVFTIASNGKEADDFADMVMIVVVAVSIFLAGFYVWRVRNVDSKRENGGELSSMQFTLITIAFADFTSDLTWGLQVILAGVRAPARGGVPMPVFRNRGEVLGGIGGEFRQERAPMPARTEPRS